MPLKYRDVKDIYDKLKDQGAVTQSLPEWSAEMNKLSGSDFYAAGLHDNIIKRASVGIDRLLEKTGLPDVGREFGRNVGSLVGSPEAGARIGEGLPRMAVNFLPLTAAALATGGAAVPAEIAGLAGAGALSGAETYTETGSPAAGLLSAASAAVLPGAAAKAEEYTLGKVGAKLVTGQKSDLEGNVIENVHKYFPTSGQKLAGTIGGQVGAAAVMQASEFGQQAIAGEPLDVHPVDMLLNMTLGAAPFAAAHLAGRAIHGSAREAIDADTLQHQLDMSKNLIDLKAAKDKLERENPLATLPDQDQTTTPEVTAETEAILSRGRAQQVSVRNDPKLSPEEKAAALTELNNSELTVPKKASADSVIGDRTDASDRTEVIGRQIHDRAKSRFIFVEDRPENPEELRGKVISYSKGTKEPEPQVQPDGSTKFGVSSPQWRTDHGSLEQWHSRQSLDKINEVLNPDLPVQSKVMSDAELHGHMAELTKVKADVDTAASPADIQSANVRLNHVEDLNNLPTTNDETLKKVIKIADPKGENPPDVNIKTAVKVQADKVSRRIQERSVPTLSEEEAANISARMGGDGFSIVTADKLSHAQDETPEAQPIADLVTDHAVQAVKNPEAKTLFDKWDGKDDTTFAKDVNDFVDLADHFGNGLGSVDKNEAAQFLNDRLGTTGWDEHEVTDFLNRPHVKLWQATLENQIGQRRVANAAPQTRPISAGHGWLLSMGDYDPASRRLNGKHVLPKDGNLVVEQFRNMAGPAGPLPAAEVELYKQLVPDAFADGKVNVPKLVEGLKKNGPVVETKKLGSSTDKRFQRIPEIEHQLDTINPQWRDREYGQEVPANEQTLLTELQNLQSSTAVRSDTTGSRYSFLGPKPESEMPGYVEGLVRVPIKGKVPVFHKQNPGRDNDAAGVQYSGPHFGSEDTNVLSFYRGYEEPLPTGEKAFHVIEVQSDWGQEQHKAEKRAAETGSPLYQSKAEKGGHPLLKVYETLALKAAIAHAKEIGATKVILSDGETAMMTEGHDKQPNIKVLFTPGEYTIPNLNRGVEGTTHLSDKVRVLPDNNFEVENVESGRWHKGDELDFNVSNALWDKIRQVVPSKTETPEPSQAAGMRLHYDQTLPSAMEKLAGKGEPWVGDTHKMARRPMNGYPDVQPGDYDYQQKSIVEGSPVFRNPDGTPKTNITGRSYDIQHLPGEFTLTNPRSVDPNPFVPTSPKEEQLVSNIGTTGHDALKFLHSATDPLFSSLAKDLAKFDSSLGLIKVSVEDTPTGSSQSRMMSDGSMHIVISPADFNRAHYVVAHELIHGLTMVELNSPTNAKFVRQFDEMRKRVIDNLSPELRDRIKELDRTNWLDRYASGKLQDPLADLSPSGDRNEAKMVYALLDTHEFVAAGTTNRDFQDVLRGIKGKDGTWFSRFTNTIGELLGIKSIKGTALEEFFHRTDNLLQRGDYVSSFSEFSNRYFENAGKDVTEAATKRRQALTVIADSNPDLSGRALISELNESVGYSDTKTKLANQAVLEMFKAKGTDYDVTIKMLEEMGHKQDSSGVDSLVSATLAGLAPHDLLDLLPSPVADYIYTKTGAIGDVLGVLDAATAERNKGLLNLAHPEFLHGPLRDATKMIEMVKERQKDRADGEQILKGMSAVAPDAFLTRHVSAPPDPGQEEVSDAFTRDTLRPAKKGLAWFLEPVAQLSRRNLATAEFFNRGYELQPNARQFFGNVVKVLGVDLTGGDTSKITEASVKKSIETIQTTKTLEAVNKWMAENQKKARDEQRGVTHLPESDPEVAKILSKLSPKDREGVIDTAAKAAIMTQMGHRYAIDYMGKIASTRAGAIAMRDGKGLKAEQGLDAARKVYDSLMADRSTPDAERIANEQLNVVRAKMTPDGFLDLLKFTQSEVEKTNLWKEYFAANPAWASAQRQEKYLVKFTVNGKLKQLQASSEKEAKVIYQKAGGKDLQIEDNLKGRDDEFPTLGPEAPELMSRLQELRQNQIASLSRTYDKDEIERIMQHDPVTQFGREAAATGGGVPQFKAPPRLLSQGAEDLPWLWNHISHAQRQSNYWTRQLFRAQTDLHLSDPEIASQPDLQKMLREHSDNMLKPDPQLAQKVARFSSVWFMGFAPASAMVNGMQTLSTLVPELTNITGKPIQSYVTWKRAVSEVVGQVGQGKTKVWKDGNIDKLMREAERLGERDFSMWDETSQAHETISTNFKRAMMKNKPQDTWQRLASVGGSYSTGAMFMFKQVEKFNHDVTLIAAYRTHRGMGMDHDEAVKQAISVNRAVNYGGGRAARPIGLFSALPRSVSVLGSNMQNYNLGVISQLSRYLRAGYFRPDGMMPSQVHAARSAAIQMLGTQLAAAGLLGMPFVSGMVALLNQAFPGLEINKNLREFVSNMFSSDHENGGMLGDMAMTGLPSSLGWDMQSRLSWGNVVPGVSENNGFQPQLLFGPPVSLISNFVSGVGQAVQGNPQGAEAFIPPGLKKLTQIAEGRGGEDYKGRRLFDPTIGENIGSALGFNPKRMSDFNAANRMLQLTKQNERNREAEFHQEQAAELIKGNFGSVRQNLLARRAEDPNYNVVSGANAVTQAAEDLTFPRDLRREGTTTSAPVRGSLLQTFHLPSSTPNELQRVNFRQNVAQRLGVRPPGRRAIQTAQFVDAQQAARPEALRSDLLLEADRAIGRNRRTPEILQGFQ